MNVISSIYCGNRRETNALYILWICLLTLIVLCAHSASGAECRLRKHNSSSSDHEKEIKLLEMIKPLNGLRFSTKDENYTYTLGICTVADVYASPGVGLMQYSASKGQNFSLGRYDAVGIMGGHDWVLLTYYNGIPYGSHCSNTNRTSHIMLICDPTVFKSNLRVLEERRLRDVNDCFYLFEIGSSVACAVKEKNVEPPHSLSSGSVFCIIVFTGAGIYLLLGFLYQRIVVGSKGLEQVPNYAFWRSFGNLQADGCDYICRCGPRQESHAYRGIDDRIRTDEERDDQLLNM